MGEKKQNCSIPIAIVPPTTLKIHLILYTKNSLEMFSIECRKLSGDYFGFGSLLYYNYMG